MKRREFITFLGGAAAQGLAGNDVKGAPFSSAEHPKSRQPPQEPPSINPNAVIVAANGSDSNPGTLSKPVLTLAKAAMVARTRADKTIYLRGGTYSINRQINLTSADNGEYWSSYPPDGLNSAILDLSGMRFAMPLNNGHDLGTCFAFLIFGGSNITIDGIHIRNSPGGGAMICGGVAAQNGWPSTETIASNNIISNCVIHDCANGGGPFNTGDGQNSIGIYSTEFPALGCANDAPSTTLINNYIYNNQAGALSLLAGNSISHPNTLVANNFIDNSNISASGPNGDTGAIYTQGIAIGTRITNNFIRDAAGRSVPGGAHAVRAIYCDAPTQNVIVSGNIVTGNTSIGFQWGAGDNTYEVMSGNIFDMGKYKAFVVWNQSTVGTGNKFNGNIIISSYSGAGARAYNTGGGKVVAPQSITDNVYYNYAGGRINYGGDATTLGDSHPVLENPQINGWTYSIANGSPVFNSPVNFPRIKGGWGPPGFAVPQIGSAPSCPH